jgi:hypothetical protein
MFNLQNYVIYILQVSRKSARRRTPSSKPPKKLDFSSISPAIKTAFTKRRGVVNQQSILKGKKSTRIVSGNVCTAFIKIFSDLLFILSTDKAEMPQTVGKKRSAEVPRLESKHQKQPQPERVSKRQQLQDQEQESEQEQELEQEREEKKSAKKKFKLSSTVENGENLVLGEYRC